MIAYPKIIFLFPMENQIVWDADKGSPEAEGAQDYVRADIHESTTTELQEEIGHLEDSLIKQGQILRDIVNITKGPPVDKIHSTHDAVESVERLQARVAKLSKDAARYQYIRSHQYWQRHKATALDTGWSLVGCKFDYSDDFQARPMLDHHIDKRLRNEAVKAGGDDE